MKFGSLKEPFTGINRSSPRLEEPPGDVTLINIKVHIISIKNSNVAFRFGQNQVFYDTYYHPSSNSYLSNGLELKDLTNYMLEYL